MMYPWVNTQEYIILLDYGKGFCLYSILLMLSQESTYFKLYMQHIRCLGDTDPMNCKDAETNMHPKQRMFGTHDRGMSNGCSWYHEDLTPLPTTQYFFWSFWCCNTLLCSSGAFCGFLKSCNIEKKETEYHTAFQCFTAGINSITRLNTWNMEN